MPQKQSNWVIDHAILVYLSLFTISLSSKHLFSQKNSNTQKNSTENQQKMTHTRVVALVLELLDAKRKTWEFVTPESGQQEWGLVHAHV